MEMLEEMQGQAGSMVVRGRRGTDMVKALTLGARAVFVGHSFLFAIAYAAEAGVAHAHELLTKEFDKDMALLGAHGPGELTSALLR